MTSWSNYARCDECGVDAGKACRDLDDREALEVCDGRRLVIDDSHARCRATRGQSRRDAPPDTSPQARRRRARGLLGAPEYSACQHCGATVRLWGHSVLTGRAWCGELVCQRARQRASQARREGRPVERLTVPCCVCGDPVPQRAGAEQQTCPSSSCRAEARRRYERVRAGLDPDGLPLVPCVGCGVGVRSRPGTIAPCCGTRECTRAAKRLRYLRYRQRRIRCDLSTMTVTFTDPALGSPDPHKRA
jgi:hypothetical protein